MRTEWIQKPTSLRRRMSPRNPAKQEVSLVWRENTVEGLVRIPSDKFICSFILFRITVPWPPWFLDRTMCEIEVETCEFDNWRQEWKRQCLKNEKVNAKMRDNRVATPQKASVCHSLIGYLRRRSVISGHSDSIRGLRHESTKRTAGRILGCRKEAERLQIGKGLTNEEGKCTPYE